MNDDKPDSWSSFFNDALTFWQRFLRSAILGVVVLIIFGIVMLGLTAVLPYRELAASPPPA